MSRANRVFLNPAQPLCRRVDTGARVASAPHNMIPWLCLLVLISAPVSSRGESLDRVVRRTIQGNYGALHGCFRKSLAADRTLGGTIFVRLTLGPGDSVSAAKVEKDGLNHKPTAACILGWIRGWTLRGAAAAGARSGADVLVPLTFRAAPNQFAVRSDDVAPAPISPGVAGQQLLGNRSVGARRASLFRIDARGPMNLPQLERSDQILFVLNGKGLLSAGAKRHPLRAGKAVWIPPGARARMTGRLETLQFFVPAGRKKGYPTTAWAAAPDRAAPLSISSGGKPRPVSGFAGRVLPLLRRRQVAHDRFSMRLVELRSGAVIAAHSHRGQTSQIFVLEGEGVVTLNGQSVSVAAGHAIHVPAGGVHVIKARRKLRLVQLFAPGGAATGAPPRGRGRR